MNIKTKQLSKFLNYIVLKSHLENSEAILNIESGYLTTLLKKSGAVGLRAILKGNFEDLGNIGIDNLVIFKKLVDSIKSEDINIKLDKNKLLLTTDDTKIKIKVNLRNPDYILNTLDRENFEKYINKDNEFTLTRENIAILVKDNNLLKPEYIILVGNDKEISFKLEKDGNELQDSLNIIDDIENFKVKINSFFIDLLSIFEEDVTISVNNSNPAIYVKVENEEYKFEYLIAPLKM